MYATFPEGLEEQPMQVTETLNDGLKRSYDCVIAATIVSEKVDAKLTGLAPTVNLPGFRPGKAPLKILRQRFGQSVMGELLDEMLRDGIQKIMDDRGLRAAGQPQMDMAEEYKPGGDFSFSLKIDLLPDFEPADFSTIEIEKLEPDVPDSEVNEALDRMAEGQREQVEVTEARPAANDDVVVIDFEGSIDGELFAGGAAEDYELTLGSGQFIPGFEEQLVGLSVGDEKTVTVNFPDDYGADHLAGKEASFKVDLKTLKTLAPAEVNDALAERMGAENVDELRTKMRETMEQQYGEVGRNRIKRDLFDKLDELHTFPLPENLVAQEFEGIWSELQKQLEGENAEEAREGKTDEELREEYQKVASRRVRLGLLLSEVGRRNSIEVSSEDLQAAIARQTAQFPGQEEFVQKYYMENPEALSQLHAPLLEDKVVDYILELAKVNVRKVPPAELLADPDAENAEAGAESSGG